MSIPRDPYLGEPGYPDTWTTKQPREGLRDLDEAKIVSLSPDVCWTPCGSSVVAVPYPIVDFCGHDEGYTSSVRFTGKKAMVMRSRTTHVHNDKPGTKKGVKSGTVGDVCEPVGHADQVRAEGSHVIRHLDRFKMNKGNTDGEALFVRNTSTYAPPVNDDPVPGSLRAVEVADASDPKKTATDAGGSSGTVLGLMTSGTAKALEAVGRGIATNAPKTATVAEVTQTGTVVSSGTVLASIGIFAAGVFFPTNKSNFSDFVPQDEFERQKISDAQKQIHDLPFWDSGSSVRDDTIAELRRRRNAEPKPQTELEAPEASLKIERAKNLAKALQNGVRVDTDDKDEWPCVVGPYKYVNMICPAEAHHIIPDMVYRLGTAPANATDKDSKADRIPNSPTYNEGQAICLTKAMHRTDDDAVHKSLNPALATLGKNYNPQGTAPLGKIRDEAHKALDKVPGLPEKCRKMAKDAADIQVGANDQQPGRTTTNPPKLPGGKPVIDVLKAGTY